MNNWQREEWNMRVGGNAEWQHHIRQLVRVTSYDQVCARIRRALERNARTKAAECDRVGEG
jgi:hypothetical protein